MKRRNFLIGTGSAAIAGSAIIGSGAFSRAESDRGIGIAVAEDPDAYLGLDACDSPNGSYVDIDEDGHLRILMNPDNPAASDTPLGLGVNSDSTSRFDRVFQICNQGTQEACFWIADHDDWPIVDEGEHEGERRVDFYLEEARANTIVAEENGVVLGVGECVCIGIEVRTQGLEEGETLLGDLEDRITITADVDGDCIEPTCAILDAAYECTDFDKNDVWQVVSHEITVTNTGDAAGEYHWATLGVNRDANRVLSSPATIGPGEQRDSTTLSTYPTDGLVWWTDECTTGTVQEYAEFFEEHDHVDLEDVDDHADAVPIEGFPSVDDLESSEAEGEAIGDVADCE